MPQGLSIHAIRTALRTVGWRRCAVSVCTLTALLFLTLSTGVTEIPAPDEGTPLVLADPKPTPADWPGFRGPSQQGLASAESHWSALSKPIPTPAWQSSLSGVIGVPCLWGHQVMVLRVDPQTGRRSLQSCDRETGTRLWECLLPGDPAAAVPSENYLSTLAPACDGERVYAPSVADGILWISAVSLQGRRSWSCPVGPYWGRDGYVVSPAIHGPLVVLAVDQAPAAVLRWQRRSYLVAVHRQTGELVWRTLRPEGASYGVPVVAHVAGRPQLLLAGRGAVRSYDPNTGKEMWRCAWQAQRSAGGVVTDATRVYAVSGRPDGEVLCVRADGRGDVSQTHVVWRDRRSSAGSASLLLAEPWLIQQHEDGTVLALDKGSGRMAWRTRVAESLPAPPVLAGRQLLCLSDQGTLHVLDVDRRGELVLEAPLVAPEEIELPHRSPGALILSGASLLYGTERGLARWNPQQTAQFAKEPRSTRQTR